MPAHRAADRDTPQGDAASPGFFYHFTWVLAILSTLLLAFNMLGLQLFKRQVFLEQATLSPVEIVLLIGFALLPIFDLVSLFWVYADTARARQADLADKITLLFGGFCPFLLLAYKVMADEIARELRLGWETLGETIILYLSLAVQLLYNLIILCRLSRFRQARRTWLSRT